MECMPWLDGASLRQWSAGKLGPHIGYLPQDVEIFEGTVAQNIGFGMQIHHEPKDAIKQRVQEMLSIIHLETKGNSFPSQLSGGQQQQLAIARALISEPKVLLLDEPSLGLAPNVIADVFISSLDKKITSDCVLPARSLLILQGEARYGWLHSIPARKSG